MPEARVGLDSPRVDPFLVSLYPACQELLLDSSSYLLDNIEDLHIIYTNKYCIMADNQQTKSHHFWDFLDAKLASVATVETKLRRGWKLYPVSQGFGATGGTANYDHALIGPKGEIFKVSNRTVVAAGVRAEPTVYQLDLNVFTLEGALKVDLQQEALRRGLAEVSDLGARWDSELRRWVVRPDAAASFRKWVSADAQPVSLL